MLGKEHPHTAVLIMVLLLAGPLAAVTAAADGQVEADRREVLVRLRPVACLRADVVRLGDIADVVARGHDAAALADIVLGRAPAAGKVAIWTRSEVVRRLQGHVEYGWRVEGAEKVYLTVDVHAVSAEELQEAVAKWLARRFPELANVSGARLRTYLRRPLYVPRHRGPIRLEPTLRSGAAAVAGRLRVDVIVRAGDQVVATVPVYLEQSSTSAGVVPAGFQTIAAPQAEPKSPPLLVRRRDVVRLVARTRYLTVTATGQALQDGRRGQFIRVRNLKSQRVVVGQVVDAGVVEVVF